MHMKAITGLLVMAGCSLDGFVGGDRMDLPDNARLFFGDQHSWIEGEPNAVSVYWVYTCDGTGDWGCPSSTITVLDIHCDGCTIPHDPTGMSEYRGPSFDAIATSDGPITMTATLQFDDTGETADAVSTVQGDREVGLEVTCQLIDSATLAKLDLQFYVDLTLFRPCDGPRLTTDTVVVFPTLRTFHGDTRFPFCPDEFPCTSLQGAPLRRLSALSFSAPVAAWGRNADGIPFAILPELPPDAQTISLSAPLLPTGAATATVDIPAAVQ